MMIKAMGDVANNNDSRIAYDKVQDSRLFDAFHVALGWQRLRWENLCV